MSKLHNDVTYFLFGPILYLVIIVIIIIIIIIIIENNGDTSNNWSDWHHFKLFRKSVGNIPGSHEVRELQKTAILGTAHILRKVLT